MDGESKQLLTDCFLRPLGDIHSTNAQKEYGTTSKKPAPHKTEMQLLSLKEESHNLIMATLKHVYSDDFEFGKIDDYKDKKGSKIKHAYWKEKGELVIRGVNDVSQIFADDPEGREKMYTMLKLEKYGFEKPHALEALMALNGTDDCINFLYEKYFPYRRRESSESAMTDEERLHAIGEEFESLASIFHDEFQEIEKNTIWQFKLRLDYLLKFSPSEVKKEEVKQKLEMEARLQEMQQLKLKKKKQKVEKCRNVVEKGKCKFGAKCKFSHDIYRDDNEKEPEKSQPVVKKVDCTEEERRTWFLEIRFPKWCKYPSDPPLILLRSLIPDIPKSICLRINQKLIDESRELAKDEIPSIFSVVNTLKSEDEILSFLKKADSYLKYPPSDISIFDYDPFIGGVRKGAGDENDEPLPTHHVMGKIDKFDRQKLSSEEILKENIKLMKKFKDTKQTKQYQAMLKVRQSLPAWPMRDKIVQTIAKHQVCIISGETGSGKSTQTPQMILDEWLESGKMEKNCEIVVTQPRRIATLGVAERICDERCTRIGGIVGYQIRLENQITAATRLTFCTTGILLRRLYSDPLLSSITHVIIDEVHERSEESDFLLLILRDLLAKRKDLKIVLMSATLNSELFSRYFNSAPIINIEGRTFPVTQYFLEEVIERSRFVLEADSQYCKKISKKDADELNQELEYTDVKANLTPPPRSVRDENLSLSDVLARYSNYSRTTCKTMFLMDYFRINPELIEATLNYIADQKGSSDPTWPDDGSILIFLPGIGEIQSVYDHLNNTRLFGSNSRDFTLIPLHSTLSSEEQSLIFKKMSRRKIILSTNIAETSITIDDVTFVIDCGLSKLKYFDNNRNMESLETAWVSRANVAQRKGRSGRSRSGVSFHLFTRHRFEHHLLAQPVPEIHRVPLEPLLLRVKTLRLFERKRVADVLARCIEPPASESVTGALKRLQNLGALEGETLTPLGSHLALLPVDVRIGKLMLFGAIFQCLDSILTICACLSHKSPFVAPFAKRQVADARKRQFAVGNSDHLTVLNAYQRWREASKRSVYAGQVFAEENFLSLNVLETIGEIKQQFMRLLVEIGFVPVDLPSEARGRRRKRFEDNVLEITGTMLNANLGNTRLISGILSASLYPNVVKILTPEKDYVKTLSGAMPRAVQPSEIKFKTKEDGYVALHPSSINASVGVFNSPFLVYQEKVKTSRIFIRDSTMVQVIPLILFSGTDIRIEMHDNEFLFILEDGWLIVQADSLETAESMKLLRRELMNILNEKIKDPLLNLWNHENGKRIVSTIIHLLTKE